jgi:PAS domain S-box-containing protein
VRRYAPVVPQSPMLSSDLVRSVLESAPDAMIIIDPFGSVLFANRQVTALFGYPIAEVVGQPIEQLLPERFRNRHVAHRRNYTEAVRLRPMGMGLDLFARRKDGSEFPVEISLSPIREGDDVLVAAAIRDVTDRKQVENEIKEAHAAADRANLAKSRFLATASHDLRQPLQSLALLNGLLRRPTTSVEDATEALEQQDQAITAMSRLLNALLDISKLESGAIKPDITDFKVAALFEELRREFAGVAASKGLKLEVEPCEASIHSDPALVGQALKNLVSNAIKYTREGRVQLRGEPRGRIIRIEVRDTGIGIERDQLAYIFDEFYQVGVATNTSRDGYGLGLSIVQRVAQLLSLRVEVKSEPGTGSTFALEVPTSESHTSEHPRPRTPLSRTATGVGGRHLLLVEDDPGVRNATRMFLKGEGFRVTTAGSLDEAIECLRSTRDIDLLVTDYHLDGGKTGTEIIGAARDILGPGLKAILVTGDTSSAIRDLQRDENLRITSKPINADELLSLIQSLLAN